MTDLGAARSATLVRMAQSRAEILHILESPSPGAGGGPGAPPVEGDFPRSRTMRTLLSGKGLGTFGALAGGLLMARPGLAFRLLRMVPAGAIARSMLVKGISAFRAGRNSNH